MNEDKQKQIGQEIYDNVQATHYGLQEYLDILQSLYDGVTLEDEWRKIIVKKALDEKRTLRLTEVIALQSTIISSSQVNKDSFNNCYDLAITVHIPIDILFSPAIPNKVNLIREAMEKAMKKEIGKMVGMLALARLNEHNSDKPAANNGSIGKITYLCTCGCYTARNTPCPIHVTPWSGGQKAP
jgi:hypothetical protein